MTIQIYDTHTLAGVVNTVKPDVSEYWLKLFPNAMQFTDQYINFDQISAGPRRLAAFVSPLVQGRVRKDRGYTTTRFEAAYVKPKDVVNPNKIISRRAGEAITGSLTPQQRQDALIAQYLSEQKAEIVRRREWMAAQAVINGSYVVSGPDYPSQSIDFNRPGGQTVVLTGTALWTDTVNSQPDVNLQTWAQSIHSTYGFVVDRVTMGGTAATAFVNHPRIKDLLDTRYLGGNADLNRAPKMDVNAREIGRLNGVSIWVYSDVYDDDAGTAQQMLSQDSVVLTASAGIDGVSASAAIMDSKAGYQPLEFFSKMWEEEDPSVIYLMTQSAPLMVPKRTASTKAKVV